MRSLITKSLFFTAQFATIALLGISTLAQPESLATGGTTNEVLQRQRQNAPKELDPNLIKINRRQPIAFKPFEMRDPETGAEIPPDKVLTFPDGKQAKAGEYYQTLNEVERGLNALGYSLREDWESITIQESVVNEAALQSQARRIRASVNPNKSFAARSFEDFNREATQIQSGFENLEIASQPGKNPNIAASNSGGVAKVNDGAVGLRNVGRGLEINKLNLPPKKPVVAQSVKEYPYSIGDPKLFAGYVNGKLELKGSEENMALLGEAKAGASIFGINADLLRLNGNMNAPRKGNMTGKIGLDVLPFGTVYSLSLDGASISKKDAATKTLDATFANFRVMVGPVPVQVKAGAQGSAGFKYYAGLNPASALAELTPFVHSKVYVQAGVDIVVAGAGAAAEMTLVNYDLSMYGGVRLWVQTPEGQTKPMLGIRQQYQIAHKLEMLNGSAYAYAYIYVPKFGVPPWKKKEWRWDIWKWNGFTPIDGELVDETVWTSLGIPAK